MATIKPKIVVYSDVNPDVLDDGPFELIHNESSIKKSLETIFLTPYGSRPFRRAFGSKILELLFEPIDTKTAAKLELMLRDLATKWEERITSVTVQVIPDIANQQYYVDLHYKIVGLGNKMVNYKFNVSK